MAVHLPEDSGRLSFYSDRRDKGRIVFVPSSAFGKRVQIEDPIACGWRAVVETVQTGGSFLITCLGDENTRNARVKMSAAQMSVKGIFPLSL